MTKKQYIRACLFIAACVMLNVAGKTFADTFELPLWLDAFGTALSAYAFGPVCGIIVGVGSNIIYGFGDGVSYIYAFTSAAIGAVIGITARKKYFETAFGSMTVSVLVTLASIVISVPLNLMFYDGKTGNVWGNGVIGFLTESGFPKIVSNIIGEFYVDFLDKVFTLMLLFGVIKLRRFINEKAPHLKKKDAGKDAAKLAAVMLCVFTAGAGTDIRSYGVDTPDEDFSGYVRTVYSSYNGLPCGEANDIKQTADGILWVGTYAGLYRYNGSEFRWMNEFDSVKNVNCLYVDEEGRLWIGTNDNGLSICINENISNVVDKDSGLPSDSVRCITKCTDGYYYIGTTESMAVLALNNGLRLLNVIPQVHYAVTLSADTRGNTAAVSTEGKLFLLSGGEVRASLELSGGDEIFTCCSFNEDGLLYVGTSGEHIYIYDINGYELAKKSAISCKTLRNIQSVEFSDDGRGFVCSDNGAGYIGTDGGFTVINTGDFNNSIDNMTVDYQGNLWFTSSRLGLLRLSESAFTDVFRAFGINGKVVNSTEFLDGRLYFGTDVGLDIADTTKGEGIRNELTEMFDGIRIRCIRRDSKNNLWFCTYGKGLVKVSPDGSIITYNSSNGSFGNRARTVTELSGGDIVAAGDTGLSFIDENGIKKTLTYGPDLSNAMILSLLENTDGAVLAGTDGDGIAVIRSGEVVRTLTRYDGLSSGVILRMTPSSDKKHIFIVTSNGICVMDSRYTIERLYNFPYPNNYDIWTDKSGKLFVMSSAGIYVADEQDVLDDVAGLNYELLDAKRGMNVSLTANSWNYRDEAGNLYLATDTGVYRLNTEAYSSKKRSYRMMVASARLDGKLYPVTRGEQLSIARGVSRIELFPEVINYTIDDPFVSYILEGFDNEPTVILQSELSTVTYTNLPSGEYTFRIAVLDTDRETVLEESVYSFVKENEIYDNRWFRVYMFVVAVIAVAWTTWFIARKQIQHTLIIQKQQLEFAEKQVQMGNETILAIAKTVDAKDENTSQHSQRVSDYSVMIAKELGFGEKECENLRKAALLHDIGKIGIPDRILNKPARLTDEEYAVMKTHVTRGAEILKDFTLIENVRDGALYHHERYDGSGYAHGLKGEDIPVYGRIIGVADAFDAMTANRVYRKKLDLDFVLGELERCKGKQFDPVMADIMLKLVKEGKIDIKSIYNEEKAEKADS